MSFLKSIILTGILVLSWSCDQNLSEEQLIEKANKIHSSVLTIDTHNDTPFRFRDDSYKMDERHDARADGTKMDFPRMKEGGLDAAFFAVYLGQGPRTEEGHLKAYNNAIDIFNSIYHTATLYPEWVGIATDPEQARQLEKEGKIAMFMGIENGYPIGHDLDKIDEFYDLGARYITLCHSSNNDICDSSTDRGGPEYNGLSDFGYQVVERMNALGIMVDVSHASDETFFDVVEHSKAPIIASHSSVRALSDNPRNLRDEMLLALKENGGVIQICILTDYIKEPEPNPERDSAMSVLREQFNAVADEDTATRNQLRREWRSIGEKYPRKLATVSDAVDHIDYVVNLIGVDHVGIGTDFDGGGGIEGCFDASEMGNITIELVRRGYSKRDIQKIWSGNIIRVMEEVERVAGQITAQ